MAVSGIVAYDANISTLIAGIAAARRGRKVTIPNPLNVRGGIWPNGLGQTDREGGNGGLDCGIALEMYRKFEVKAGLSSPQSVPFVFPTMKVVAEVYQEMLAEVSDKVTVTDGAPLETVTKDGATGAITSIRCGGVDYPGSNLLDGGDEIDLARKGGCMTRIGRESALGAGLPTAGLRPPEMTTALAYNPSTGERLPGLFPAPSQSPGMADRRTMARAVRMMVTDHPSRLPFADAPITVNFSDYNAELAIAIAEKYAVFPASEGRELLPIVGDMLTRDANNGGLYKIGTNLIGAWAEWDTATWARREELRIAYIKHKAGLFKAICTDPRWAAVDPVTVNKYDSNGVLISSKTTQIVEETKKWGWVPGLFSSQVVPGMSPMIYVRNSYRLVGQDEWTFDDITLPNRLLNQCKEPVVVGGYGKIDFHWYERYAHANGRIAFEGGGGLDNGRSVGVAQIPWGCMKPRVNDCPNLLVTHGISGQMIPWSNVRIEKTYVKLGQVAGEACALADELGIYTSQLSYANQLRPRLENAGMVLTLPGV